MKFRYVFILLLFLNFSCAQITSKPITKVSEGELSKVQLLDVRTPQEFNAGHLKGAIHMNWFSDDFNSQVETLNKKKTIYVYCKLGGRSAKAQERLKELGFTDVVNLEGGYDAWSAARK